MKLPLTGAAVTALLERLEQRQRYVLLDSSMPDAGNSRTLLFIDPVEQLTCRAGEDRRAFLERLTGRLDHGFHLAGWFAYEFLHETMLGKMQPPGQVLADLGVYRQPLELERQPLESLDPPVEPASQSPAEYRLRHLGPAISRHQYLQAVRRILEYIAAGDTYQVNYTFKYRFEFSGSIAALYRDLRRSQPVPYGGCLRNGSFRVLSFSPELFFRIEPGRILARPMKGTMKRGRTREEDAVLVKRLGQDQKNRSENVMIVDLLRNDLSRLLATAGGGRVAVSSLFEVERYRTVLQMTSEIIANGAAVDEMPVEDILSALFPCGSVTGAPKIRTMEIIDQLEPEPRGVYTGAIGYFGPDRQGVFNVPIRTLTIAGNRGELGIGSGIVADSIPEQEWEECLLKARFLTAPPPEFKLIETMFYDPGSGYLFLEAHLDRLEASAGYFGFPCDRSQVGQLLQRRAGLLSGHPGFRVRLTLDLDGRLEVSDSPCTPPVALSFEQAAGLEEVPIGLAAGPVDSREQPHFFHKTTRRQEYDLAQREAGRAGLFDLIFWNREGEVTEGAICNLFVLRDGCYYTPARECGLLDGVMRRHLLEAGGGAVVRERVLNRDDVRQADRVFVCNSVRGVLPARFDDGD